MKHDFEADLLMMRLQLRLELGDLDGAVDSTPVRAEATL